MSKTKKILSIVLAVMMIANLFAFSASALRDPADSVAIIMKSDKTKLVAGETITLSFYLNMPVGTDYSAIENFGVSSIPISFDKNVLTYVAGSRAWNTTAYADIFADNATVTTAAALHTSISGKFAANNEDVYGYNSSINVISSFITIANGGATTTATGFTLAGPNVWWFTVQFKVADNLPAGTTTTIGVTKSGFEASRAGALKHIVSGGTSGGNAYASTEINLDLARLTLSDKDVAVFGQDCKVRPGTQADPTSYISGGVLSNLDLRLEAKFDKTAFDATYAPASAGAPCQNMDEVGFIVAKTADITSAADLTVANANGSTIKKQAVNKIQDKSTYYNMVLAISGIPAADIATEYTYVAYITNGANTIYSAPATAAAADRDYLAIPNVTSLA